MGRSCCQLWVLYRGAGRLGIGGGRLDPLVFRGMAGVANPQIGSKLNVFIRVIRWKTSRLIAHCLQGTPEGAIAHTPYVVPPSTWLFQRHLNGDRTQRPTRILSRRHGCPAARACRQVSPIWPRINLRPEDGGHNTLENTQPQDVGGGVTGPAPDGALPAQDDR